MQIEQIRDRPDHQHVVTARDALHKGVLIVEGDNLPQTQPFFQIFAQILFAQRLDVQLKRQIQVQRGDGLVPVFERNFPQFAAHQVQRAFHQIVHRLAAGAFGGDFVHQPHQHRHHQETHEKQQEELHKELSHCCTNSQAFGANR
ncbi:hypothetical protein D3C79_729460 [compost metagenome]